MDINKRPFRARIEIEAPVKNYKSPDCTKIIQKATQNFIDEYNKSHIKEIDIILVQSFMNGFNEGLSIGLKESLNWYNAMRKI